MHDKLPSDLLNAVRDKRLIPVVGAGISMSLTDEAGGKLFPSWSELLGRAADEIEQDGNQKLAKGIRATLDIGDFQQAATYARRGLEGTLWNQFFKKHFEEPIAKISDNSKALPKAIWGLGDRLLTLNYDKVLRGACPNFECLSELDNSNKAELADFKRGTIKGPAIWHFHGRIGNISTLIFTAESYCRLYFESDKDYQAALVVFRELCSDQRLLFVGCSLEDAELLGEMNKQHQLFGGNTGPHYALVHRDQHDAIKQKTVNLPLRLLTFDAFGDPLVQLVNAIAKEGTQRQGIGQVKVPQNADHQPLGVDKEKAGKRIALLTANPLDDEQQYGGLLKEFKKITWPIDHFSLSIDNLNTLEGYDYLLILSNVVKNKLLIEDEYLCSRRISFKEMEGHIGNDRNAGIFIFVDQLPDPTFTKELRLPTLILAELEKKQLEGVVFQLFRRKNLTFSVNCQLLNKSDFALCTLTNVNKDQNKLLRQKTSLPDSIDPKTFKNFVGRTGDLEQISRKLMTIKEEGGFLTIKGSGGIGKTTLVKKLAVAFAERAYFEGGIYFVDCESGASEVYGQ